MADEEKNLKPALANTQEQVQQLESEKNAGEFQNAEDSIALTRTKGAYQPDGKRYTQSLKEKKVPQRVVAAQMNQLDPLTEDDIDDETLIAPSRQIIGSAYRDTAQKDGMPSFRSVAESNSGDDTLALQSSDNRNVQTVSFKVKGIQWRSGFADSLANTPLGHAIHPNPLPSYKDDLPDSLRKSGIVIRPVNPRLRVVLNQLLPPDFRKKVSQQRRKTDRMRLLAIFYLPGTPSSHVGFIHEFIGTKNNFKFYLYIQTSVGKAPVAILDEVLKTLEAGLPEGEKASDLDEYEVAEEEDEMPEIEFDFAGEVQTAMKQAGDSFNNSIMVYGMKQSSRVAQDWSLEAVRVVDRMIAWMIRRITWFVVQLANSPIIRAIAASTQFISKAFVQFVWALNKVFLAIARSPVTRAIGVNLIRVFKVIGRLFVVVWLGFKWILLSSVAIFSFLGNVIRDPKNTTFVASSIQFPSFGKGLFGDSDDEDSKEQKKIRPDKKEALKKKQQLTANRSAAKRRLPPPKPIKKGIPALPGTKGAGGTALPGSRGGVVESEAARKQRELGYFEDQAF